MAQAAGLRKFPVKKKGKSQWLSTQFGLSFVVCRAIHDLLSDTRVSPRWSSRAKDKIASLRTDYEFLDRSSGVALVVQEANELRWFTFFGTVINLALTDAIRRRRYDDVKVSDFWIRVSGTTDHLRFFDTIESLTPEIVRECFQVPAEYLDELKFSECLPQHHAEGIMKERLLPLHILRSVLGQRTKAVLC